MNIEEFNKLLSEIQSDYINKGIKHSDSIYVIDGAYFRFCGGFISVSVEHATIFGKDLQYVKDLHQVIVSDKDKINGVIKL